MIHQVDLFSFNFLGEIEIECIKNTFPNQRTFSWNYHNSDHIYPTVEVILEEGSSDDDDFMEQEARLLQEAEFEPVKRVIWYSNDGIDIKVDFKL